MGSVRYLFMVAAVVTGAILATAPGFAQGGSPAVRIVVPREGAVVRAGDVRVEMTISGATLVPADNSRSARTGHFHLYLDKVPAHVGRPIPQGIDGISHTAARTFVLKNVSRGLHTLILVWAHGDHVPFAPWVSDTIMFEAR